MKKGRPLDIYGNPIRSNIMERFGSTDIMSDRAFWALFWVSLVAGWFALPHTNVLQMLLLVAYGLWLAFQAWMRCENL